MKCPVDGATLVKAERSGVEIDCCAECPGVWLDWGELDKIIERSAAPVGPSRPTSGRYDGAVSDGGYKRRKKRDRLLDELFDF